jgi:hypothetical protein
MTMSLIETATIGSGGASSITFDAIAADWTDLKIVISARSTRSGIDDWIYARFNGDTTTSHYSNRWLNGTGSSASSGNQTSADGHIAFGATGSTATSNTFGNIEVYIPNYASANQKSSSVDGTPENNATSVGTFGMAIVANLWNQTDAITSITLTLANGDFVEGSTATIYGITKGSDGIVTTS